MGRAASGGSARGSHQRGGDASTAPTRLKSLFASALSASRRALSSVAALNVNARPSIGRAVSNALSRYAFSRGSSLSAFPRSMACRSLALKPYAVSPLT